MKQKTMKKTWIAVGESIHASIPKTGKVMKRLSELGPDAYSNSSEPLDYIKTLIEDASTAAMTMF